MSLRLMRADVPAGETWNLADLYPDRESWATAGTALEADVAALARFKGSLTDGATLLACITQFEAVLERGVRWVTYANLLVSEDGSNPENQAAMGRAYATLAQFEATTAFIKSELLALPSGTVEGWITELSGLAVYRPYLDKLLVEKPYLLHPETEEVLAVLGEVTGAPALIDERAKNSDMQFEPITGPDGRQIPVSLSLYEDELEISPETEIRRSAYRSFTRGLSAYKNTLAATFATEVKKYVVLARLRRYESATQMLLAPQQIDQSVYENLLDVIQAELAPHMRRYARLRKRVLGLDKLLYCDIEAPLDPEFQPEISYDGGTAMVRKALSVLGSEYSEIIGRAIAERWVDRCDNVGKQSGAFCASPYGVHSYVLMTWTGAMRGVFTLAHELGHAGHFELANRAQQLLNVEPSRFFVEAPSTMNELLLAEHILSQTQEKRMRRWVIMQLLMTYHHNFVRHLLEGELQRRIYALAEQGTPITAVTLCETKEAILEQFWGTEVEIDEGARLTWMRQPHYYMGLYSYSYSAGLTAATAAAQAIKEEGQPAVERWLTALKAGGSLAPMELMALAGVDMRKPDPIRKAVAYVGSLIDELERSF